MLVFLREMDEVVVEDIRKHDSFIVKMDNYPNIFASLIDFLRPTLGSNFLHLAEFI